MVWFVRTLVVAVFTVLLVTAIAAVAIASGDLGSIRRMVGFWLLFAALPLGGMVFVASGTRAIRRRARPAHVHRRAIAARAARPAPGRAALHPARAGR